jgi:hypothetical protein
VAQQHSVDLRMRMLLPLIVLVAAACSGAKPKQAGEENNFDLPPPAPAEEASTQESGSPQEAGGLNPDQKKQMEIALHRGGEKAKNCAEVVPDAPAGEGEVKVIFDGQKGRVTDVLVGPPFAGTPVEACLKRAFVGEIVMPFEGDPLEVPYSIKLPGKAAPAQAGKPTPGGKK